MTSTVQKALSVDPDMSGSVLRTRTPHKQENIAEEKAQCSRVLCKNKELIFHYFGTDMPSK
jgi:hypothetical protein